MACYRPSHTSRRRSSRVMWRMITKSATRSAGLYFLRIVLGLQFISFIIVIIISCVFCEFHFLKLFFLEAQNNFPKNFLIYLLMLIITIIIIVLKNFHSGNFATVFKAVDRLSREVVAVKRIKKLRMLWGALRKNKFDIMSEVLVMTQLQHPHIIRLHKVYDSNKELTLVMEFAGGGQLLNKVKEIGRYPEDKAKIVVRSILSAIQYMHEQNAVHRDLKPDNIVLMSTANLTDVKLTDFGFSKLSTLVNTPSLSSLSNCGFFMYIFPLILPCLFFFCFSVLDSFKRQIHNHEDLCGHS
jgi:tRNA A-37 threonylcarbamoyl transferase component Bud32